MESSLSYPLIGPQVFFIKLGSYQKGGSYPMGSFLSEIIVRWLKLKFLSQFILVYAENIWTLTYQIENSERILSQFGDHIKEFDNLEDNWANSWRNLRIASNKFRGNHFFQLCMIYGQKFEFGFRPLVSSCLIGFTSCYVFDYTAPLVIRPTFLFD